MAIKFYPGNIKKTPMKAVDGFSDIKIIFAHPKFIEGNILLGEILNRNHTSSMLS